MALHCFLGIIHGVKRYKTALQGDVFLLLISAIFGKIFRRTRFFVMFFLRSALIKQDSPIVHWPPAIAGLPERLHKKGGGYKRKE